MEKTFYVVTTITKQKNDTIINSIKTLELLENEKISFNNLFLHYAKQIIQKEFDECCIIIQEFEDITPRGSQSMLCDKDALKEFITKEEKLKAERDYIEKYPEYRNLLTKINNLKNTLKQVSFYNGDRSFIEWQLSQIEKEIEEFKNNNK